MDTHVLNFLLTNRWWLAAQGIIQNSTVFFWAAAGFGLGVVHQKVKAIHEMHKEHGVLLREIHDKLHEDDPKS